jgi:hypothetical protein
MNESLHVPSQPTVDVHLQKDACNLSQSFESKMDLSTEEPKMLVKQQTYEDTEQPSVVESYESESASDAESEEGEPSQQDEGEVETPDLEATEDGESLLEGDELGELPTIQPLDFQSQRRLEQQQALEESAEEVREEEPVESSFNMMRKGAVAALGGTMVGLGLIMIPLPIPLGVVVASSGMAVLGAEFESARKMNDKILDTTKTHMNSARDRAIRSIQSMEDDKEDKDTENGDSSVSSPRSQQDDEEPEPPISPSSSLYMNPKERERQEQLLAAKKLAKEKARRRNQTTSTATYAQCLQRRTGSFLSRRVLPLLKQNNLASLVAPTEESETAKLDPEREVLGDDEVPPMEEHPAKESPNLSAEEETEVVVDASAENTTTTTDVDTVDETVDEPNVLETEIPIVVASV